jgi:ATP-binding cassette subfamily F protein uup
LIQNPNFLVLDEPTNDLDIETLNVLEEFLENFGGSVVLVSHDRYFMDKVIDHVFVFEGEGTIMDFPGNYTDYREWLTNKKADVKAEAKRDEPAAPKKNTAGSKTKLGFKEQRELEEAEAKMQEIEARKLQVLALLNGDSNDHEELMNLSLELESLEASHEAYFTRWIELSG